MHLYLAGPLSFVRFWTIQPLVVWERMELGEEIRVDPDHPRYGGRRPWQHEWLADGLRRNHPGFDGGWPWWLSCTRPDLGDCRTASHPGGREQTIIELDLLEDRYITFPLWMWETIHSGIYLAASRGELETWYRDAEADLAGQDQLEASWQRLFDVSVHPPFWYRDEVPPVDDSRLSTLMREASEEQVGLTQELRLGDARDVTRFEGAA